MATVVKIQKAPTGAASPQAFFEKGDFDEAIWSKGNSVLIEKALRCPCKSTGGDNLSNCKNCGGSGWIFINPVKTKALLTSQNATTQFKNWSELNLGNVNITVRDIDRIGFMDRITNMQGESLHTQTAFPKMFKGVLFSFLDYNPKCIHEVFLFKSSTEKLILLKNIEDYEIIESKIILNTKFISKNAPIYNDMTLSLRYTHAPQYHILDIIRDIMVTPTMESFGNRNTQMPISAQGRRAHLVLNRQNFEGNLLFDNSYQNLCEVDENGVCKSCNNNNL